MAEVGRGQKGSVGGVKMKQKMVIEVKKGCDFFGEGGETVEVIERVLRAEAIGNFVPVFCTYKGKKELVSSKCGDLSDPFRVTVDYLLPGQLFIKIKEEK